MHTIGDRAKAIFSKDAEFVSPSRVPHYMATCRDKRNSYISHLANGWVVYHLRVLCQKCVKFYPRLLLNMEQSKWQKLPKSLET